MTATRHALLAVRDIIDISLESADDLTDDQTVKILLSVLPICECDDYNGYECGCQNRTALYDEAIKEIEGA